MCDCVCVSRCFFLIHADLLVSHSASWSSGGGRMHRRADSIGESVLFVLWLSVTPTSQSGGLPCTALSTSCFLSRPLPGLLFSMTLIENHKKTPEKFGKLLVNWRYDYSASRCCIAISMVVFHITLAFPLHPSEPGVLHGCPLFYTCSILLFSLHNTLTLTYGY